MTDNLLAEVVAMLVPAIAEVFAGVIVIAGGTVLAVAPQASAGGNATAFRGSVIRG